MERKRPEGRAASGRARGVGGARFIRSSNFHGSVRVRSALPSTLFLQLHMTAFFELRAGVALGCGFSIEDQDSARLSGRCRCESCASISVRCLHHFNLLECRSGSLEASCSWITVWQQSIVGASLCSRWSPGSRSRRLCCSRSPEPGICASHTSSSRRECRQVSCVAPFRVAAKHEGLETAAAPREK